MSEIKTLLHNSRLAVLFGIAALLVACLAPLATAPLKAAAASTLPAYRYTKLFDTSTPGSSAYANSITTDASGIIYLTGSFSGTVTFDGTGGSDTKTSTNRSAFLTKYNPSGSYAYTKTFDTSTAGSYAYASSIATDASGNSYLTGQFSGTVTFDGTGGSDTKTSANSSAFLTKYNPNGSYAYTKTFDTSTAGSYANGRAVTTDPLGNIYLTGSFSGTVTFDGPGGSDTKTSANYTSFLTKYNPNGSYAYTKTFDTSTAGSYASGTSVATGPSGNIYLTGYFYGTTTFDGTGGSDTKTSANTSAFLTKYNPNGSYAYTKTFDTSTAGSSASGFGVATDPSDNSYLTGYFYGTVTFDGPGGSDTKTSANASAFLTKYNADGSYAYTKTFDTSVARSSAYGYSITTDPSGNVYLVGEVDGTVTFNPGDTQTDASGNGDTFLTKFNADGSYAYSRIYDSTGGQYSGSYGVALDKLSGNIYLSNDVRGTYTFDGTGGTDTQTSTNETGGITSFHVFDVLGAATGAAGSTVPVPGAPNSGFAFVSAHPAVMFGLTLAFAGSVFGLARKSGGKLAVARAKSTRRRR